MTIVNVEGDNVVAGIARNAMNAVIKLNPDLERPGVPQQNSHRMNSNADEETTVKRLKEAGFTVTTEEQKRDGRLVPELVAKLKLPVPKR